MEGGEILPFGGHEGDPAGGDAPPEDAGHGGGFAVEEGYVEWVGLPGGLGLKLGRFFQQFGQINRWHAHSFPFQSRPLPHMAFFGEEGLGQTGASLRWLAPFGGGGGTYEATIEVDRNEIMDDAVGVYNPVIAELGRTAAVHPDELVFELLGNGFSTACYDGQYFFDTDHPVGDSTVSNHGGGAGTAWFLLDTTKALKPLIFQSRKEVEFVAKDRPDDEHVFMKKKYLYGVDRRDNAGFGLWQLAFGSKVTLDEAGYAAAREAMLAMKDAEGKPLGITPNLLVVPPSLESEAREVIVNDADASGATNKWQGTAELLVVPWL